MILFDPNAPTLLSSTVKVILSGLTLCGIAIVLPPIYTADVKARLREIRRTVDRFWGVR